MPEELQFLWRQAATVTPLSGSDLQVGERGPDSTDDSEKERECEMVEMAEREERHELSPKEVGKGVWFGNICRDILSRERTGKCQKMNNFLCLCVNTGP